MFEAMFQKYISAKNIVFFIIAILFIIFITKIKDIAILFFASYVIACSLNPVVDKLTKKMSRSMAAGLVVTISVLVIGAFFIPIIFMAGHEIKSFIGMLPQYVSSIKTFIVNTPFINQSQIAQMDIGELISSTSDFTTKFVNGSINFSMNFASAIVYFLAAIIIIYYFISDKDTVRKAFLSLFPAQMKDRADEIIETISQKIGGYVVAQIATMTSVGIIMAIGLMLLRVDYALLLGLLSAIFDIIPVVGPGIALAICLLSAIKSGPVILALIVILFIFSQWAENNLVRPYIFSKFLDLHPLIIYFFLFVTAQYLGVIGVIFAPAIAATVCVLIEELYIKTMN